MTIIKIYFIVYFFFPLLEFSSFVANASEKIHLELKFPSRHDALPLNDENIGGMTIAEEKLYFISRKGTRYFSIKLADFHTAAKSFDSWKYINSHEIPFPKTLWGGFAYSREILFFFDRKLRRVGSFKNSNQFKTQSDYIRDLIRPAADSKGEPIWQEILKLRKNFAFENAKYKGSNLGGVTQVPEGWRNSFSDSSKAGFTEFFSISNIPGFPLLVSRCEDNLFNRCKVDRSCFVNIPKEFRKLAFSGLATLKLEGKKIFVAGLRDQNILLVFKFRSCYSSSFLYAIKVPEKIKGIRSLEVDSENALYLVSLKRDSYLNASMYKFKQSLWLDRSKI